MTLELLESLGIFKYPNELMEVSAQASSEASLEALLKKVKAIFVVRKNILTYNYLRLRKPGNL